LSPGRPGGSLQQLLLVKLAGHLGDAPQLLPFRPPLFLLGGQDGIADLDSDLFGQTAHGFRKGQSLHAHQKGKHVAPRPATEAVENLPLGVDIEGGRLLAV